VRTPYVAYLAVYTMVSMCTAFLGALFAPLLLLDVIFTVPTLTNVLRAITLKGRQLALVFMLTAIVILGFSVIYYFWFRHYFFDSNVTNLFKSYDTEFEGNSTTGGMTGALQGTGGTGLLGGGKGSFICENLLQCFTASVMYGLGDGRGVKQLQRSPEVPDQPLVKYLFLSDGEKDVMFYYWWRTFMDLASFLCVNLVLRSMIFGIVLASFAQLREKESKALEEMKAKCFICSISRMDFDRNANGFDHHTKYDHNMWSYLYYMVKVQRGEPEYYTSVEMYVAERLENSDINWFPLHHALVLDSQQGAEDNRLELQIAHLSTIVNRLEDKLANVVGKANGELKTNIDTMNEDLGERLLRLEGSVDRLVS